jgi:hypothetical protein
MLGCRRVAAAAAFSGVWLVALCCAPRVAAAAGEGRVLGECGLADATARALHVALVALPEPNALARTVCEWFRLEPWRVRIEVHEQLARPSAVPAGGATVVITLVSASEARLDFSARDADTRTTSRRIALDGGLDETGREIIAQVLHSSVLAYAATREIPHPKPEPPPPPPAPARRPPAPAPSPPVQTSTPRDTPRSEGTSADAGTLLRTALGFHFYARGPEPATFGPTLLVELDWQRAAFALGAFVRGGLWKSTQVSERGFDLGLGGAHAQLGVAAHQAVSVLDVRAALAFGAEWPRVSLEASGTAAARNSSLAVSARPFVAAEAGAGWRWQHFELSLAALVRWQFLRTHYDVTVDGQEETLLRPWRLQPGAQLDVAYLW